MMYKFSGIFRKLQIRARIHKYACRPVCKKLIIILVLVFPTASVFAEPLPLDELIEKIQARYEQTRDLEARFVQDATIKSVTQTLTEEGTVYFKKPRRMLWDYSKPSHKKLVINPRKAWLYIPDDNLVYIQDAKKLLTSRITVRFIAGIGKLKGDFKIASAPENYIDKEGNYLLSLIPHSKKMGIEQLFMQINKDTFDVMNFTFTDIYGNTTRLTLTKMKINNNLPDSMFYFTPPAGTQIVNVP
jgi:outer membrane lipoprotein carrier protein